MSETFDETRVRVYVPADGEHVYARARSAIVGREDEQSERTLIYYEDGQFAGGTYADLAMRAAGRMVENYPTIAKALIETRRLHPVGWLDMLAGEITVDGPAEKEALEAWAPGAVLTTSEGRSARKREFDQWAASNPAYASNPAARKMAEKALKLN